MADFCFVLKLNFDKLFIELKSYPLVKHLQGKNKKYRYTKKRLNYLSCSNFIELLFK